MKNAVQSFFYGICAIGVSAALAGLCSAVKSFCRQSLKRGKFHDGK